MNTLERVFDLLTQISVKGEDVYRMADAMTLLQQEAKKQSEQRVKKEEGFIVPIEEQKEDMI